MENAKNIIKDCALIFRIKHDAKKNIAYGKYKGFEIVVYEVKIDTLNTINVTFCSCSSDGYSININELNDIEFPENSSWSFNRFRFDICVLIKMKDTLSDVNTATRTLLDKIISIGGINCDEEGSTEDFSLWRYNGKYSFFSDSTVSEIRNNHNDLSSSDTSFEKPLLGAFGAIIGAILGGIVVLLIARLGYVSSFGAIAIGIFPLIGYKIFSKKYSIIGAIICILISAVTCYLVFRIDLAMDIKKAFENIYFEDISFFECFERSKEIAERADSMDTYNNNLFSIMTYGVIGALAFNYEFLKDDTIKNELYKIS